MEDNPINDYDQMTVGDVKKAISPYTNGIEQLTDSDIVQRLDLVSAVLEYEHENKERTTAIAAIEEVHEFLKSEARPRGLLTADEERIETDQKAAGGDSENDGTDGTDSATGDTDGDRDSDINAEESDRENNETVEGEDEDPDPERSRPESKTFYGADGKERILVRNHNGRSANIAGFGFDAGEVKEVEANDRVLTAVRRNNLQVVRG
jgi:hypothetical protein